MSSTELVLFSCYSENILKDTYSAPKHFWKQFPGDLQRNLFHVPSLNQALPHLSQLKLILLVLLTWKNKRKLFFSYLQFHLKFLKAIILSSWSALISREALLVLQCFLTRCVFRTIFSMRFAFLFQQICLDHVSLTAESNITKGFTPLKVPCLFCCIK